MIPRYRAWLKEDKEMVDVEEINFFNGEFDFIGDAITWMCKSDDCVLMQSTGLTDKNGKEIFEGDILKFNDTWSDYCYEGYVDGEITGVNYVEIEKETTCFGFGKTRIPESSLFDLMNNEHLAFKELITDTSFEFEIIGNVWEDGELLDGENTEEN